jgi:hypothetical protein
VSIDCRDGTRRALRCRLRLPNPCATCATVVDVEKYRQRLLVLEREFVRKLECEVEAARTTAEDQPQPGDQSVADKLRET